MDTAVIIIVITLAGNVIGWATTLFFASRNHSRQQGKDEQSLEDLIKEVNGLPCKSNPEYQRTIGAMVKGQEETNRRLSRIEYKIFNGD